MKKEIKKAFCFFCVAYVMGRLASGTTCNRPPIPDGGYYTPKKILYSVGDTVEYFCDDLHLISQESKIVCNGNNDWGGTFPICDNRIVATYSPSFPVTTQRNDATGIDKNDSTCLKDFPLADYYEISLNPPSSVDKIRLTTKRELKNIEVKLVLSSGVTHDCSISSNSSDGQSVFTCGAISSVKGIRIHNVASTVSEQDVLCEVQAYFQSNAVSIFSGSVLLYNQAKYVQVLTDKDLSTCVDNMLDGTRWLVLSATYTVKAMRFIAKSEFQQLTVYTWSNTVYCKTSDNKPGNSLLFKCPYNSGATWMGFNKNPTDKIELCEYALFANSASMGCPLKNFGIQNGNVIYNSTKAWLQCDAKSKPLQTSVTCHGYYWSDTSSLKCEAIECNLPEAPEWGKWTDPSTSESPRNEKLLQGMNLEMKCNSGYAPNGNQTTITCLGNSSWSQTDVLCVVKPCQMPPNFPHGKWINPITNSSDENEFVMDTSVELVCENGYRVESNNTISIKCISGGFWIITESIAGCTNTFDSNNNNQVQLEGDSATLRYAAVNFQTVSNSKGIDQNNLTCVEDFTLADGYNIQLKQSTTVDTVRITAKSVVKDLEIFLQDENYILNHCDTKKKISDSQTDFMCQTDSKTKSIQIRKKPATIYQQDNLCEIELFYQTNALTPQISDGYLYFDPKNDENGIDQETSTCVESFPFIRSYVVSLKKPDTVIAVRLTTNSDFKDIAILLLDDTWNEIRCETKITRKGKQVTISCPENHKTEHVMLRNIASAIATQMELCEVEILIK